MKSSQFLLAAALSVSALTVQAESISIGDWSNGTSGSAALTVTGNNNNLAYRNLATAFSGTDLFVSLDMTTSAGSLWTSNDFVGIWLDNVATGAHTSVPNFGIKSDISGSSDIFARSTGSLGSAVANSALSAGQSFSLLARVYKAAGSSTFNAVQLWFNPTATDSLGTADASFSGNSGLSSISKLGIRTANLDSGDSVSVSNVKLGTTFADVSPVPEASSLGMMLAGLGMMGVIARRRIRA